MSSEVPNVHLQSNLCFSHMFCAWRWSIRRTETCSITDKRYEELLFSTAINILNPLFDAVYMHLGIGTLLLLLCRSSFVRFEIQLRTPLYCWERNQVWAFAVKFFKVYCCLCTLHLLNLCCVTSISEELGAFIFRAGVIWASIEVLRIKAWHQTQAFFRRIRKIEKVRRVCLAICLSDYLALSGCVFM